MWLAVEKNILITVKDFKNQMFYETMWRFLFQGAVQNDADEILEILDVDYGDAEEYSDLNSSEPVVDNYFKPEFFQALQTFIQDY